MIENIVKNKKKKADKIAEIEKKKIDFVANQFNENINVLKKFMKKYSTSSEIMYNKLHTIIENLVTNLHLEPTKGESFQLKHAQNSIYVKLGYYKILGDNLDFATPYEQVTLTPTEKGRKIAEEYKKISRT